MVFFKINFFVLFLNLIKFKKIFIQEIRSKATNQTHIKPKESAQKLIQVPYCIFNVYVGIYQMHPETIISEGILWIYLFFKYKSICISNLPLSLSLLLSVREKSFFFFSLFFEHYDGFTRSFPDEKMK